MKGPKLHSITISKKKKPTLKTTVRKENFFLMTFPLKTHEEREKQFVILIKSLIWQKKKNYC